MRILVTGASGFIGQSVHQMLAECGHEVIPVGRYAGGGVPLNALRVDLREKGALERMVFFPPDWVVHLAAVIPSTFEGPEAVCAADENRLIDSNVFRACLKWKVGVIYTSSASVYGFGGGDVKTELSLVNPIGLYAESKLFGERLGREWLQGEGIRFIAFRITAPYGPHQHVQTVLNIFLDRALLGLPIFFHGTGVRQQDFIHTEDISRAVLMAMTHGHSGIYNIASGLPVTMRQLAELVVSVVPECTSSVEPSGKEDPQEGVMALYDVSKARLRLGWQRRISLQAGIRTMVESRT